jgi:hypothetical protein
LALTAGCGGRLFATGTTAPQETGVVSGEPATSAPDANTTTTIGSPTSEPQSTQVANPRKRGVASGEEVQPSLSAQDLNALSPAVGWWYNWTYKPSSQALANASAALDLEYVPMVFTAPFDVAQISASILPQSRYLLTFNEPNFDVQGNLTPEQAASYWPDIERIADAHNLAIVSPALNFCGGGCNETDPMVWFDKFFAACANCRIDYLALHAYVCYGTALSSAYLDPFWQKYHKKIWLTEFSCLDGSADATVSANQSRYMQEAITVLESNPNVFRYAWFIARSSTPSPPIGLLGASGVLTDLGEQYISLPQATP